MSERWKLPFRRVARVQSQGAELVRCGTTARLVHSASASAGANATASEQPPRTATAPTTWAGQLVSHREGSSRTHMEQATQRPISSWGALCQGHDGSREGRRLKLQA